ncbi:MAG: sigma-54 dependent transcriptional regulator [Saprospiraceae bacterium]|nr:sigma-54 dependent transcriptional regulator [Saprospiraceae bacterium]
MSSPTRIFVVEDDPVYIRLVKYVAEMNPDHEVFCFKSGKECIQNLYRRPDIISLDYSLPDMTGEEVLKQIKKYDQNIVVLILSGQKDIATVVQLLKTGAYDYITKDKDTKNRLFSILERLKERVALKEEVEVLKEKLGERYEAKHSMKGQSPVMQKVFKRIERACKTNITVSVTGETGTGKELVAKTIHYESNRSKGNFVAINVSAIPKELLESELFGHEKGAFTGASTRKIGQFERAHKGTLFLDEIGEMEIHLQAKILRALQEREITRIGGNKIVKFDTRIIVATHRNLAEEVQKGNFRQDLYYRLLGLPIHLPPLKDRGQDIIILAQSFLREFCATNKIPSIKLLAAAKNKLLSYHYPGNVRELKAIIELAAVMTNDNKIRKDDISFMTSGRNNNFLTERLSLKEYNLKIVQYFMQEYNNNVLQVAKQLKIGKSTIYRMLQENKDFFDNGNNFG